MDKPLKVLDLFAGIGGFSYAAEQLVGGFETTQFVEWNKHCHRVLTKHWPEVPIHSDIKTFHAKEGEFDVITGGFPCQDPSVQIGEGMYLNPSFVEEMMGFPVGWSDLDN